MKLLFWGVQPSKAFLKTVTSHGFSCSVSSKIPSADRKLSFELVVLGVKQVADLKKIEQARKKFRDSWIAVVTRKSDLNQSEFHSALIDNEYKDVVWLEESWESMFWFSYQQMLEATEKNRQVKNLEREVAKYRERTDSIADVSNKLLDKFKKDLDLAENIQRALRPRFSPHIPGISLSVKYIPSLGGGGDYYDIFEFGDKKRFGILLADSNSHGLAAALLTVLLKLRIEEMKDRFPDSCSFIAFLNREIRAIHNKSGTSMSLLYGILDRASLTFQYTSAGNLTPILWREGQSNTLPNSLNPQVGEADHFEFREETLRLEPGDLMVLHTNGLDAPVKKKVNSGVEGILRTLSQKEGTTDPLKVQNELMGLIDEYLSNKKLKEDVTLLQLSVDPRAMYVAKAEGDQSK